MRLLREDRMEKSDTRVLLFEKDRNFAAVIEGILKSEGYEVVTASTPAEVQIRLACKRLMF